MSLQEVKRTERIQFRISKREKEIIERYAAKKGLNVADFIRRVLSNEIDKDRLRN